MGKKPKSLSAQIIDDLVDAERRLGIDPPDSLSIAAAKLNLGFERLAGTRTEKMDKMDNCAKNKKVLKYPTGSWMDDTGSADVKDIDIPTVTVKAHDRTLKSGRVVRVRKHHRVVGIPKWCRAKKSKKT